MGLFELLTIVSGAPHVLIFLIHDSIFGTSHVQLTDAMIEGCIDLFRLFIDILAHHTSRVKNGMINRWHAVYQNTRNPSFQVYKSFLPFYLSFHFQKHAPVCHVAPLFLCVLLFQVSNVHVSCHSISSPSRCPMSISVAIAWPWPSGCGAFGPPQLLMSFSTFQG